MTSNLGSQLIMELGDQNRTEMLRQVDEILHRQFRPEFLNRIDETIIFHSLTKEDLAKIVEAGQWPPNAGPFQITVVATNLEIGSRLYFPGERNRWEAWVSLKFTGKTYGGQGAESQVLCDRVILVRRTS